VTAAVAATTAFNIGHSQTVPRCMSETNSNRPAARGKLMFRNHYSQVMLMYKRCDGAATLLISLAEPPIRL
jgi:hypothetical protein